MQQFGNIKYHIFDMEFEDKNLTHKYSRTKYAGTDIISIIEQNRKIVSQYFGQKDLLILNQQHSDIVYRAGADIDLNTEPYADSSITSEENIVLGIYTADCVPILLYADNDAVPSGHTISAIHAGWRGALAGIIENSVDEMLKAKGTNIKAIIGPAIAQQSYQIDKKFYDNFNTISSYYKKYFIDDVSAENKYLFNLAEFVKDKLGALGVEIVHHIAEDTYTQKHKYPSYRRVTHGLEEYKHNILSCIMISNKKSAN